MTARQWAIATPVFLAFGLGLGWYLAHHTDSPVPYLDALLTSGSLVAQWMMTRKLLENWAIWIALLGTVGCAAIGFAVVMRNPQWVRGAVLFVEADCPTCALVAPVLAELRALDVDALTPKQALDLLYELRRLRG